MGLTFYIGKPGSGKTRSLLLTLIDAAERDPSGNYLILVPEQFTMQTQKELLRLHPAHGTLNIDVLSLNRLAFRVFAETGTDTGELLEEIGKTFLLEKTALEERKNLSWFGEKLAKPGNLAEMKAMISELLLYGVTPEQLLSVLTEEEKERKTPLFGKLTDLSAIYRKFQEKIAGHYMTAEEIPSVLASVAERSDLLKESVIALDGFTGFTPLQLELLKKLIPLAREVHVTVTADPDGALFAERPSRDLFFLSSGMLRDLKRIAEETRTPVREVRRIRDEGQGRLSHSKELSFLERTLFRPGRETFPGTEVRDLRIRVSRGPREETAEAALLINRAVREKGYRFRDIAVLTGDPDTYGDFVREIFPHAGIPFFVDEKRSLLHNPYIEYLRAALEACGSGYSYDSMMRLLKSGASDFEPGDISHLENYLLAAGVRGKNRWRTVWVRHYAGEDPAEVPLLNRLREEILAILDPLADALAQRGGTVLTKTKAVYEFLVRSRMEEKLAGAAEAFLAAGEPGKAREYEQVWPYLVHFLEKLAAVLGDEKISMRDYTALLEAGFAEARVGLVPPGIDQVLVGDLERTRLGEIRMLILLGANEGLIPKAPERGGVLTEADRETLGKRALTLKPSTREAMYIGQFYLYLALTKPKEELVLSCAAAGTDGGIRRPAYLVEAVRRLFPALQPCAAEAEGGGGPLDAVEHPEDGMRVLVSALQDLAKRDPGAEVYELLSAFSENGEQRARAERVLLAAGAEKKPDFIGEKAAALLYGKNLRNSASRLELFYSCRFAHFLQYGLRLKERPEYAFTGMDLGTVLHASLEHFAKEAGAGKVPWGQMEAPRMEELARACLASAVEEADLPQLMETPRSRYDLVRMERLLERAVRSLQDQLAAGAFVPSGIEADFRSREDLSSTHVKLPGGSDMTLLGRIDRIDVCEDGDTAYVKVIDYKTGAVDFDLSALYYGLQLQLAVYMNAALEMLRKTGKAARPAGMFYYRIQDPLLDYKEGETEEERESRFRKELRVSGLVSSETRILSLLDKDLSPGGKSEVIPVSLKKDGSLAASSKAAGEEAFAAIGRYASHMVREAAAGILTGEAKADPYEYRDRTACTFCGFRGICGFDLRLPGCSYRELRPLKTEDALEKMEEALGDGGKEDGR